MRGGVVLTEWRASVRVESIGTDTIDKSKTAVTFKQPASQLGCEQVRGTGGTALLASSVVAGGKRGTHYDLKAGSEARRWWSFGMDGAKARRES